MLIGYSRVSSPTQRNDTQDYFLNEEGCERIYSDVCTGRSTKDRVGLSQLLAYSRRGDTIVVTRVDRLTRSASDFLNLEAHFREKGIELKVLNQPEAPLSQLLAAVEFAEKELQQINSRQREGIEAAKVRGVYMGRRKSIPRAEVHRLLQAGQGASAIARTLKIAKASVYRIAAEERA